MTLDESCRIRFVEQLLSFKLSSLPLSVRIHVRRIVRERPMQHESRMPMQAVR